MLKYFGNDQKTKEISKMQSWESKFHSDVLSDIREMKNFRSLNLIFKTFKKETKVNLNKNFFRHYNLMWIFCVVQIVGLFILSTIEDSSLRTIAIVISCSLYFYIMLDLTLRPYYDESKRELMNYISDKVYSTPLKISLRNTAINYEKDKIIDSVNIQSKGNDRRKRL